jgi:hypothetical protein
MFTVDNDVKMATKRTSSVDKSTASEIMWHVVRCDQAKACFLLKSTFLQEAFAFGKQERMGGREVPLPDRIDRRQRTSLLTSRSSFRNAVS